MTYATDEQRLAARKASRQRYHQKVYVPRGPKKKLGRPRMEGRGTREFQIWEVTYHRARRNGLEFTLDWKDIKIPDVCPVLNIPICLTNNKTGSDSPSIDRKDTAKGYTPDNIRIISWRANKLKGDGTIEELEKILAYMRE